MPKKSPRPTPAPADADTLFVTEVAPRRQVPELFIPRILEGTAASYEFDPAELAAAAKIVAQWADFERKYNFGGKNEGELEQAFLHDVFVAGLGYVPVGASEGRPTLAVKYPVPGVGTADAALGVFNPDGSGTPYAVVELKGPHVDLDRDKSNGRTAVQQCWDYLNALPESCVWGVVSNFRTVRLYHRRKTTQAYQPFRLQDLRRPAAFAAFFCIFKPDGLMPTPAGKARAVRLLEETETRQREVGDHLYDLYSTNRRRLIDHLIRDHGKALDAAIRVAQVLIDRIVFIAFCEDRGLLRQNSIAETWKAVAPYAKATNPRWRNFLELFEAVDRGHNNLLVEDGFNGGLFKRDPEIDDLQLPDDPWADFFRDIGNYDFRTEVTVEVLGHLFEKSIGELEELRLPGIFSDRDSAAVSAMPKSAERKRGGVYYTPPDFTAFLVREAVGTIIDEQQAELRAWHKLTDKYLETETPNPAHAAYWQACLDHLKGLTVCDPACGSGAFLIEAYDHLEKRYDAIIEKLAFHTRRPESDWLAAVPDHILTHNLYGVDLSPQAVEITQLSLWLRSADPGKKLADLSKNIVHGNSLVTDKAVHEKAMVWAEKFPAVFGRPNPGFDAVVGNPPWERLKLQEREFFAHAAPEIAGAVSAATRRKLIAELATKRPELFERYTAVHTTTDKVLDHVRTSGEFPLTAKGDINTYMLFAELARKLVAPRGRVGLLVPSGIATDNTTREFFADLMDRKALAGLYDFENKAPVFPDVHRSYKFCALIVGGSDRTFASADFVFFAHEMADLAQKKRHIPLSQKDIALLNPNTKTCPIFRTRRDADLTKAIYRRVPILIDQNRKEGGNPWGISFKTMFHQTNDAELFRSPEELKKDGWKLTGNRWVKGKEVCLPLYEAKMFRPYDHRFGSVFIEAGNWMNQGQTDQASLVDHMNTEFLAQPRWWCNKKAADERIGSTTEYALLTFRDITRSTDARTALATFIPYCGVLNTAPIICFLEEITARQRCCLLGNINSVAFDFVTKQKVGGIHLNFFILEQLPTYYPSDYVKKCPWAKKTTLEKWISDRVLKLTCTANDMVPLAEAAGFAEKVHKWDPAERAVLTAELDAAYFHLYGINRDDAAYILGTFQGLHDGESDGGLAGASTSQADLILTKFDELATAMT